MGSAGRAGGACAAPPCNPQQDTIGTKRRCARGDVADRATRKAHVYRVSESLVPRFWFNARRVAGFEFPPKRTLRPSVPRVRLGGAGWSCAPPAPRCPLYYASGAERAKRVEAERGVQVPSVPAT